VGGWQREKVKSFIRLLALLEDLALRGVGGGMVSGLQQWIVWGSTMPSLVDVGLIYAWIIAQVHVSFQVI
jgi:hypothetical protein